MANVPLPATRSSYWQVSRAPRYSVSFALPLLVLYEVLAAMMNPRGGGVRNGADVILKSLFVSLAGPRGPLLFGVVLVGTMIALIVRDVRRSGGGPRPLVFVGMMLESLVLAVAFGFVVGLVTAQLVSSLQRLAIGGVDGLPFSTALVVSLGAGLYEELLFRVVLVSVLLWVARRVLGLGPVASSMFGVVGGALIFSAFHYVGPYGDRLEVGSFVFRAVAGLAFSGLYVTRGFGITAWTHALYDIGLLAIRGG